MKCFTCRFLHSNQVQQAEDWVGSRTNICQGLGHSEAQCKTSFFVLRPPPKQSCSSFCLSLVLSSDAQSYKYRVQKCGPHLPSPLRSSPAKIWALLPSTSEGCTTGLPGRHNTFSSPTLSVLVCNPNIQLGQPITWHKSYADLWVS